MLKCTSLALVVVSLAACGTPKPALNVQVAGLPDNSPLPVRFTGDGADVSPSMAWSSLPVGTKALAVIVQDPDAPGGNFTHWVIYDLPVSPGLPEGLPPQGEVTGGGHQGINDFGRLGWNGPAPPGGKTHHYLFEVFALASPTGLPPGATVDSLRSALKTRVLAQGRWTGTYRR